MINKNASLRTSLLDAVQPLERAAVNATSLAEHYRRYDLSRGNQGLTDLAAELRALAILVVTTDDTSFNDHIGSLSAVLGALIAAQASEDWVTVADVIEYDLEPSIRAWATAIANVAEGQRADEH